MPPRLRPATFSTVLAALAVLSLACNGVRGHDQQEGVYQLTVASVLRDDCGWLAGTDQLFSVELVLAGDTVQLKHGMYDMLMRGQFLSKEESFRADGSATRFYETIRGAQCLVDVLSVHVDAQAESPTSFTGTATLYFQAETDACTCRVWTTYRAVKQ